MQFADVIGQHEARERLLQLVSEQRVPHAMLFTGPEGSGKLALALAFASYLLGERYEGHSILESGAAVTNAEAMLRKFEHPDLHFSYPVIKPKGSSADRKVTSDDFAAEWRQMLKGGAYFTMSQWMTLMGAENQQSAIFEAESDLLSHKLNMKSSMSGYKVSIIWLAERMNVECSNKLLKLLEEPPQKTVFPDLRSRTVNDLPSQERMNELYESRPYFPGDDPRKIHWKLYAHTNTLSIKLGAFEPPPVKRLTIYIEEPVCMKKKERAWVASIFDAFIGRLSGVIIELLNAGIQCSLLLYDYPQQSLQRYEITEEASAAAAQIQNLLAIPALRASPEALPDAAEVFNAVPDGGGLLYCYMPTGGVSRNAAGVSFRPSRTEDITGVETFFCLAAPPVSEEHTPLDERAHRVLSRRGIHRLLYSSAASARQDAFYRKVQEAAERELRIFTAGNCHAELL